MEMCVRSVAIVVALSLCGVACADARSWNGGAGTTAWNDANNWSPAGVPGARDDVTINWSGGTVVVFSSGVSTVKSLSCSQELRITGGQFGVTNEFAINGGGTLDYSGGALIGSPALYGATLKIGASATAAVQFALGGNCPFQGSIHSGQTVWIKGGLWGHAALLPAAAVLNEGTILLESAFGAWNSDIWCPGTTLTNGRTGHIVVNTGAGGARTITGSIANFGALDVDPGTVAVVSAATDSVLQAGGTINALGRLRVASGLLHLTGGQTLGNVSCQNGTIDVEASVTLPSTVQAEGPTTALVKNASASTTIRVTGGLSGHAVLNTNAAAFNDGTIVLRSEFGTWNSDLKIMGSSLANNGSIQVQVGAGGPRNCSNGTLVNAGSIAVEAGCDFNVSTGFSEAGGSNSGNMWVYSADVSVTASPAAPTVIALVGPLNTLHTNNLPNVTLWVYGGIQGHATLKLDADLTNSGVIRLESGFSTWNSDVSIPAGTLTNAANGAIDVNASSGGYRNCAGRIVNQGSIDVESGIELSINGPDPALTQAGGLINAPGRLRVYGGALHLTGGQTLGNVSSLNGAIDIEAAVTSPSLVQAEGGLVELVKNASTVTEVHVAGGLSGHARLQTRAGAFNAGTIRLESLFAAWESNLVIAGGEFTNTGAVQVRMGAGGPRVSSSGTLVNAGSIAVETGTTFNVTDGFSEAGGTNAGDMLIYSALVAVTASPAASTELTLVGGSNTLTTDNLARVTLWVRGGPQGHGTLNLGDGTANHGTLRLESTDAAWTSQVSVAGPLASVGTLINAPEGFITAREGSGGARYILGSLTNAGTLEPRYPSGLAITGNYVQQSTGLLACEFAGLSLGQFSRLAVSGDAQLAGAISARRAGNYAPPNGTQHEVLLAASRSGIFANVQSCDGVLMSYTPTQAILNFVGISGVFADLTGDGLVDGADLGLLLGAWGTCGVCCPADLDASGDVDGGDLGALLGSWS